MSFEGFDPPESNFWRLPNNWFDIVVCFTSWAEHKVVEYILRHTWGYHEYNLCKQITMDEFMRGRKRRDGSRMDAGCGMAENSIKKGIADAVAHGFLVVEVDDSDRGRIKKFYGPRMRSPQRDEGAPAVRPMTFPSAQEDSSDAHDLETAEHGADARPGAGNAAAQQTIHSHQVSTGGQHLRVQGQRLTPEEQAVRVEDARLTPTAQTLTPHRQRLNLQQAEADPHTEKESPVQHLRKATRRQQTRPVAVFPNEEHADREHLREDTSRISTLDATLLRRLVDEGITPAKARALVGTYPAERIVRQLGWIDARGYQNRQATLIAAIERDYTAPAPRRPSRAGAGDAFDGAKFYSGTYAVCPQCGSRPCICEAPRAMRRHLP
jgi:hypothetical protein